jgi:hypothetical protein
MEMIEMAIQIKAPAPDTWEHRPADFIGPPTPTQFNVWVYGIAYFLSEARAGRKARNRARKFVMEGIDPFMAATLIAALPTAETLEILGRKLSQIETEIGYRAC